MKLLKFNEFLNEDKMPLSDQFEEYTVNDMGEGKFIVNIDNVDRQFSVVPIPDDMDTYVNLYHDLNNAINSKSPLAIYNLIKRAEKLPYKFGNLFPLELSLNNISELSTTLTEDQQNQLKLSEHDFLKNNFATLDKSLRATIMKYLYDISKMYAIVLESLFYYTRTGKSDTFYDSMDYSQIIKTYDDLIKKYLSDAKGPFDIKGQTIDSPSEFAYWSFNKDTYYIRATTSPSDLNSEENIRGVKGLSLTILDSDKQEISKEFVSIPLDSFPSALKKLRDR